jgi:hypothetical protein
MYIGNDLQIAHPSYKIIDDISSSFNGSTTSFALQVSGETPVPFPISTQQVMISVNGVVQEPDPSGSAGFKLLGSNIVFSSAPANGHAFFGVINAGADYVTAGSEFPDGSATAPSFTFQDDQDTGWFRNASGDVGYSSNGTAILNFDGNGLTVAAGKGLTVDTSTFKVDATNNRVGIGTTSPEDILHIKSGKIRIENAIVSNNDSTISYDNSEFLIDVDPNNVRGSSAFQVKIDGTLGLVIDDNRRVLIGTTTEGEASADNLTIADSANCGITIRSGSSNAGGIYFSDGTSGADEYKGLIAYNHSSDHLELFTSASKRMQIDSSGRVGIGASNNTSYDANAQNLLLANESGNYGITIRSGGGDPYAMIHFADGTTDASEKRAGRIIYQHSQNTLKFSTANTEALTIDSSQNASFAGSVTAGFGVFYQSTGQSSLRIGSGNAGGAALVLDGDSNGDGSGADYAYIKHDTSGNLIIAADDPAGDAELRLHVGNDSEEFRIDSAGRCIVGGGSHIGGSALVVKGGNQNNYSTAGFFSNHTNPTSGTDLAQLRFGSNATGVGATIDIVADADWGTNDFPTKIVFKTCPDGSNSRATALTIDRNKHVTAASYLSDQIGDVRSIPQNATTSAYTLVALDNGKAITNTSGGVTIPNGVFGSGSAVSIINHSGSDITLTQASGLTIYNTADGTTGNRTLAARGMATVWFQATSTAYISGAGLS